MFTVQRSEFFFKASVPHGERISIYVIFPLKAKKMGDLDSSDALSLLKFYYPSYLYVWTLRESDAIVNRLYVTFESTF